MTTSIGMPHSLVIVFFLLIQPTSHLTIRLHHFVRSSGWMGISSNGQGYVQLITNKLCSFNFHMMMKNSILPLNSRTVAASSCNLHVWFHVFMYDVRLQCYGNNSWNYLSFGRWSIQFNL